MNTNVLCFSIVGVLLAATSAYAAPVVLPVPFTNRDTGERRRNEMIFTREQPFIVRILQHVYGRIVDFLNNGS